MYWWLHIDFIKNGKEEKQNIKSVWNISFHFLLRRGIWWLFKFWLIIKTREADFLLMFIGFSPQDHPCYLPWRHNFTKGVNLQIHSAICFFKFVFGFIELDYQLHKLFFFVEKFGLETADFFEFVLWVKKGRNYFHRLSLKFIFLSLYIFFPEEMFFLSCGPAKIAVERWQR